MSDTGFHMARFSGAARLFERRNGGAGAILKFERVRLPRGDPFQPLLCTEVTPEFLDRAIHALKRWNFDFVSIADITERAQQPDPARRFVCLTFDGGGRDFMKLAYPVLSQHGVPFALYVAAGFVDGIGEAWWLALEAVIARNARIALVMDGAERRFNAASLGEKYELYALLYGWLRSLPPHELSAAIADLCKRHSVALNAFAQDVTVTWPDLAMLARDPQAIIGSATLHYSALAPAKGTLALREMSMGKSVIEAALGEPCSHFAFPFGERGTFGPRDVLLAEEAGFATAVSSVPGLVRAGGKSSAFSLPRIAWDGRRQSISALRTILSGMILRREREPETSPEPNYG